MTLVSSRFTKITVLVAALSLCIPAFAAQDIAKQHGSGPSVQWQVKVTGQERAVLTVSGADGATYVKTFGPGQDPSFSISDLGGSPQDGDYHYELRIEQKISAAVKAKLAAARANNDDSAVRKIQKEAGLQDLRMAGNLKIISGSFVSNQGTESDSNDQVTSSSRVSGAAVSANAVRPGRIEALDQVIPDDLIVQSSLCVGFDCVDGESFGFDTIRMKENNTQLNFDDTSTSSGFPANDWRIIANDTTSGGANKLVFNDATASRNLMTLTAAAPADSIFVASTGKVGFRQASPLLDLHVTTADTPAVRLEQTSAGGFTAQTWDIGANEANFFVRDLTGGSRLSFRIRPGAPTSSIDIAASGNVGVGTASPTRRLHVVTTGATDNTVLEIQNDAAARIRFTNTANAETWNIGHQAPSGTGFVASDVGDAVSEMLLDVAGNMTIAGTLTQGSSRELKKDFAAFDPAAALTGVQNLPIMTWVYKDDQNAARHVGPIAEEFHAAFGLGADDKHIAPSDQAGLALAAIKGLSDVVQQKDARIQELESRLAAIEKQIATSDQQQ
jgi:hypothetical protein